ncbi:hypothetical protein CR532_04725 (plasmid) [Candidatus Borreliella tachyglossi]|uniref:Lipoprotein n=1 Tax=Candidatus Borreliella tachyglossi TaxID=1964448 RepID=A0A2S1LYI0_9SPIR|nr:hypothetical protein [Candidatus Borreliella tachyglossi]AWG43305.1 hypothetical protein CR532_04725 [Candidatus Borreliella tachyglossi]
MRFNIKNLLVLLLVAVVSCNQLGDKKPETPPKGAEGGTTENPSKKDKVTPPKGAEGTTTEDEVTPLGGSKGTEEDPDARKINVKDLKSELDEDDFRAKNPDEFLPDGDVSPEDMIMTVFATDKLVSPLSNLNIEFSLLRGKRNHKGILVEKEKKTLELKDMPKWSDKGEVLEDIKDAELNYINMIMLGLTQQTLKTKTNNLIEVIDALKEQGKEAGLIPVYLVFYTGEEIASVRIGSELLVDMKQAIAKPGEIIRVDHENFSWGATKTILVNFGDRESETDRIFTPDQVTYDSSTSKIKFSFSNYTYPDDNTTEEQYGELTVSKDYVRVLDNLATAEQLKEFVTNNQAAIVEVEQ